MGFDLGEYARNMLEVADVELIHPLTGETLGAKIQVLSPDSDEYQRLSLQRQNENIKFARKNRGKTTAEKMAEDGLNLLVAITVGWEGIEENGQPIPFTQENARRIYKQFPFIKEQVDEFAGDRRNFIRN